MACIHLALEIQEVVEPDLLLESKSLSNRRRGDVCDGKRLDIVVKQLRRRRQVISMGA